MTKQIKLLGALIVITLMFSANAKAADICVATSAPDCASLGYTSSSCPSGSTALKCPWGAKYFCVTPKCQPWAPETGCASGLGTKNCSDGCGGTRQCCNSVRCANGVQPFQKTKPSKFGEKHKVAGYNWCCATDSQYYSKTTYIWCTTPAIIF